MDSKGMGGETVQKTITVMTGDPARPALELILSGQVKPIAHLSATVIRLTGNAGEAISKTITITPAAENPFKIKTIRAENGQFIRQELTPKNETGSVRYDLTVVNTKPDKGFYTDKILIQTDSVISPVLEIRVMGVIRDGS